MEVHTKMIKDGAMVTTKGNMWMVQFESSASSETDPVDVGSGES